MAQYDVDLILSVRYPWLLPESLLEDKRIRLRVQLNFHNSHFPKYRGPNAFGWSICNGDKKLGLYVPIVWTEASIPVLFW